MSRVVSRGEVKAHLPARAVSCTVQYATSALPGVIRGRITSQPGVERFSRHFRVRSAEPQFRCVGGASPTHYTTNTQKLFRVKKRWRPFPPSYLLNFD